MGDKVVAAARIIFCSFCGKSQLEVRKMIAGPTSNICSECIELSVEIINEEPGQTILPPTIPIAATSNEAALAEALIYALGNEIQYPVFTHSKPIQGYERSGRMLFQHAARGAAKYPVSPAPAYAANELMKLAREGARYVPEDLPGYSKGWNVSCAVVDGRRVAVLWTEWVKE